METEKKINAAGKPDLETIKNQMIREQRDIRMKQFFGNPSIVIGAAAALFMIFIAVFAVQLAPYDPYTLDIANKLKAPSSAHWFGTDNFGRDLLSRIIYGARISMIVGGSVAFFTMIFGLVIGMYAGFYPTFDKVIMRICDGMKAIPSMMLAIALVAVMGSGLRNIVLSLTVVYIPDIARVARTITLQIRKLTYIEALKASGATTNRIIWWNVLPNVISSVFVNVSYIFATAVITEASLSFLGVGVPVPEPSWGNIINEGKVVIHQAWWMIVFPGIFTACSVLGLNLLGDGLRDFLDPLTNR